MDKTIYTLPDGGYIQRVDRRIARKLYDAGKPVWAQAAKMRPAGVWSQALEVASVPGGATFDAMETAYMYYNCTPETGTRVAWYAQPVLSHDSNDMPCYCAYGRYKGGYLYRLDKPLTDAQCATLAKYRNVKVMRGCTEFAPEIRFNAVWLGGAKA